MGGKDHVSDGEWSTEDINSCYINSDRNLEDDLRAYMQERRFSWPLLKTVQTEITVDKFEG